MPLNEDLLFQIKCMTRLIYYVTDEDDQAIVNLRDALKSRHDGHVYVYNGTFGMKPIDQYIDDWGTREHKMADKDRQSIHDALIQIYKDDPKEGINFYLITDAERWMKDEHVVRRMLNITHQVNNDIRTVKIVILIGCRKVIPQYLQRYVQVVHDKGPDKDDVLRILAEACDQLSIPTPPSFESMFRGMTTYEIKGALSQSIIQTQLDGGEPRIDPGLITNFRRHQFAKTDLVQQIDTARFTFAQVGGMERFKDWVRITRHSWTEKGRAFGLKPPKGVLAVGVWGCGKSLATKAMGQAWGLPVVQLEMGRIRSNQVGESEANIYRVLRLVESAAPCIVWVDEAEKSLSGLASSAASDAGVTSRVIGIFSTWLQETDAPVCLAMTANSLKTLPVEFINRMDERFFFDTPSTGDRTDILKIHLKKVMQDPTRYQLHELAEKAKDMVGREIEQAIGAAMTASFDQGCEHLDEDILANILLRKPRIVKTMQDDIAEIVNWVGYDAAQDDGIKARFASKPDRGQGIKMASVD